MKNRLFKIGMLFIVLSYISIKIFAQAYPNPVAAYGQLETDGPNIIGSKVGIPVQVKGLSFFWDKWGGEKYWNAGVVNDMVDNWKCEVLRVASTTCKEGACPPDVGRASTVIDACINRGIYVVIDFHAHYADQELDVAKGFFETMAQKYGSKDNVIFEIWNEPLGREEQWLAIKNYADQIIPIIRKYSDNIIIVGTPHYAQMVKEAVKNPITNHSNIAYVFHFYALSHYIGSWEYDQMKDGFGVLPLFCSEWGMSHSDGGTKQYGLGIDRDKSEAWWQLMDKYKYSSCMWSIFDAGQASSIYDGAGAGGWIKDKLNQWRNVAPWVTGKVKPDPLTVNAGFDRSIVLPWSSVTLEGTKTGGRLPYTYVWKQISGPSTATISTPDNIKTTISNLKEGEYVFEFSGATPDTAKTDQVKVTVYADGVIPDGLIDNMNDNDITNFWEGTWETNNDSKDGAKSIITPAASMMSNGTVKADYTFDKGTYQWAPHVDINMNLIASKLAYDLTGCSMVTYDYKGDSHTFKLAQDNIGNGAFHKIEVPASTGWTTATLDFSKFGQPGWNKEPAVALDLKRISAFSWGMSKETGSGSLEIDNVACYGAIPAITQSPNPRFASGTNSSKTPNVFVLSFNKLLSNTSTYAKNTFSFTVNDIARNVDAISHTEKTVTVTLSGVIAPGDKVAVSYNGNSITDPDNNPLDTFSNKILSNVQVVALMIADAENDGKTFFGTMWDKVTGSATNGSATADVQVVAGGADNTAQAAKMTYNLGGGEWQATSLGFNTSTTTGGTFDFSSATGIGFWHKGDAVMVMFPISANTGGNHHMVNVPAHADWTWVETKWSQVAQRNGFGTVVTFDPKIVTRIQWEANSKNVTNGTVFIDQVMALGMKPLSDKSLLNAKIALAKSIVNDSISGLDIGNYTTVATTALGTKIAAAETVSNNAAAKQADVDAAATALETGLFDVEKARLQNTIQAATNIMNNGSFPASAKAQLATIITESTTILQSATTRDQLVNATNNIIAGVNNMRNSNGQALKLTRGWNMITINVQSADSTITSIFKNTSISEIKTSDKFWSKNTPIQLNSLNVITTGQAYLVKITNISDSIFIAGKNISAQSFPPTNLKSGWNLVGYPHTTSQSISTVLSSTPSIITVKNTQGFWIKGNQLSNLSEFKPGECYYIKKQ